MRLVLTALALTILSVTLAAQQQAPPAPSNADDPFKGLPTLNPAFTPLQVDLGIIAPWKKAMREKYEGKYQEPAPRLPDGKPDLTGVWISSVKLSRPDVTPLGLSILEQRFKRNLKDLPYSVCLPLGPAPFDNAGGIWEVLHTQTRLVTLFESTPYRRLVFIDGRSHPTDPDPTWMGHSVGRWEGDTLVVETTGLNDRSWLEGSLPHTDKLRILERWTRPTMGSIVVERTYEDPDIFVKPWAFTYEAFLAPGEQLLENICENNKFKGL